MEKIEVLCYMMLLVRSFQVLQEVLQECRLVVVEALVQKVTLVLIELMVE